MGRIDAEELVRLKGAVDLVELVRGHGVELKALAADYAERFSLAEEAKKYASHRLLSDEAVKHFKVGVADRDAGFPFARVDGEVWEDGARDADARGDSEREWT